MILIIPLLQHGVISLPRFNLQLTEMLDKYFIVVTVVVIRQEAFRRRSKWLFTFHATFLDVEG